MKNLVLSEKAYDDLLGILKYIARDKPQTAVKFVDQIQEQCKFLARFPESGTRQDDLAPPASAFSASTATESISEICRIASDSNASCRPASTSNSSRSIDSSLRGAGGQ